MRIQTDPPVHLTYCLNVHPGESWQENLKAIADRALEVRHKVAPRSTFGLGLRLSAMAASELSHPDALGAFRQFLDQHGLYVFTVNGFPYGRFHDAAVKQEVYSPDWRTPDRARYTMHLADILADLMPEEMTGSISSVPGSYRTWIRTDDDIRLMTEQLASVAAHLDTLRRRSGRLVQLALEPEADCFIETTDQAIAFLNGPLREFGSRHPALQQADEPPERILQRHIGVCFDTAHAAVQFEDPAESLRKLQRAGVTIPKIQLSAALEARPNPGVLAWLRLFCDPVYLHQVKVRTPAGRIVDFADLEEAIFSKLGKDPQSTWRVHFHVPLFFEAWQGLQSTSAELQGSLAAMLREGASEHLEIETYTFNVMPNFMRPRTPEEGIAREFNWVLEKLLKTT